MSIFLTRLPSISFILAALHLPSKNVPNRFRTEEIVGKCHREIVNFETEQACPAIVVGDFNTHPFERVLASPEYFHAVSSAKLATGKLPKYSNRPVPYFYNPSWSLLSDLEGPAGTYYYSSGEFRWSVLDQVLIRPALVPRFERRSLRTVTQIGQRSLLSRQGIPQVSDHLPVAFSIDDA